ncbi:MAG: type II toxin-antitoxin system HigB family toxin [Saprospiraceae bacterium]|nr:type II toxin-antitoxin system HigB family toxin [Candidatus Brachybacter algidus]
MSKRLAFYSIALREWFSKLKKVTGIIFRIKRTFNHVDYVGNDHFVFNKKGNQFRLVAMILFKSKKVFIRFIGSHKKYDDIDYSNI